MPYCQHLLDAGYIYKYYQKKKNCFDIQPKFVKSIWPRKRKIVSRSAYYYFVLAIRSSVRPFDASNAELMFVLVLRYAVSRPIYRNEVGEFSKN